MEINKVKINCFLTLFIHFFYIFFVCRFPREVENDSDINHFSIIPPSQHIGIRGTKPKIRDSDKDSDGDKDSDKDSEGDKDSARDSTNVREKDCARDTDNM